MFNGRHFAQSGILLCVRGYLVYNLSPQHLEEITVDRSIPLDYSTIHLCTLRYAPLLLAQFNHHNSTVGRKRSISATKHNRSRSAS
jgi:transposase-like protein